jgi:hemolysin activation/secretion protein
MKCRKGPLLAGVLLAATIHTVVPIARAADASDTAVHFDISRFDVRGNTLLSPLAIDSVVAPFVGKHRDFADVMGALEALEAAYHARGYQLVHIDLPEQELDRGVVVLNVVEAKIGRVTVEGNKHFDTANVRRSLPALQEGQTPDLKAISKSLKLANENPAKKTVMSMQTAEGDAVDAKLAVTDESPWTTAINLDNTGTGQTGRTHAGVVLQNANAFGLDDVLSLQYTTTVQEPSRVAVYGVGYHLPLYALGDSIDVYGNYSDVDSGTVTAGIFDIAVSGKGAIFGARYNHNLTPVGNYTSKLVAGIDYKAYKNNAELLGVQLGNDITVRPVSIGYQGNWASTGAEAGAALTLLHNISGGSRGGQQDFDAARIGATAGYTALRLSASVSKALPADWLVRAIVNGQYTGDALVPSEQFGAGGASSVRGFEEREVANDSGVSANIEAYTPSLCRNLNWQCRMLAFYDGAYLTRNHALPGEFRNISISSTGIGARLTYRNNVSLQVDVGHVLTAEATATQAGSNRVHVRLGLSF